MMIMLKQDDRNIVLFDSPEHPPKWIETIDIENQEYRFCDDRGQRYVGVIVKPIGIFRSGAFELRPEGPPDVKNALELVDAAAGIEPNERHENLESLRRHLTGQRI
jgi:hypothetical protein